MLKKLFKYDFISTGRSITLFAIICLVVSIIGAGAMKLNTVISNADYNVFTSSLTAVLSILTFVAFTAVFAFFIVSVILILRRYYTNLFTDEGYLTFTLPVKPSQILLSKFISGYIWGAIALLISIVSMFILICIGTAPVGHFFNEEVFKLFKWIIEDIVFFTEFPTIFENIIYILLVFIVGAAFNLLYMYLAITLGSIIAKKHKIITSIGFYYAMNTILGMVVAVYTIVITFIFDSMDFFNYATFSRFMFIGIVLVNLGLSIVAFIVNKMLLNKKLNLQ